MNLTKDRLFATAIHLAASVLTALFAATVVFAVWRPYPYRGISGGRELFQCFARANEINAMLTAAGHTPQAALYLPMVGRKSFWTVFLDPASGEVLGFMPLNSF